MSKIVVLLAVAAFGYAAQSPPKLKETFQANCTAELHHEGETIFGYGFIMRDQNSNKAMESSIYNITAKDEFATYRLERLDMHTPSEYYYRGVVAKTGACSKIELPPKYHLQLFWDWLDKAELYPPNEFVHKNLAYWTREVGGVRFILGVEKNVSNPQPRIFFRISAVSYLILEFKQYTEDPKMFPVQYFEIPEDCDMQTFKLYEAIRHNLN